MTEKPLLTISLATTALTADIYLSRVAAEECLAFISQ